MRLISKIFALALLATSVPLCAQSRDENWTRCLAKNPDIAISGCTALIQSDQEPSESLWMVYYDRGQMYHRKSDYDHAIQDFNDSIRLNQSKHKAETYYNRGNAYGDKGDSDHAIQDFTVALSLEPDDSAWEWTFKAWNGRCFYRAVIGQVDAALTDCNQALKLRPNNADNLDSRGFTYLKMKNPDASIADYNAALAINPKLASSLYGRGLAEKIKGNLTAADKDIAAAKAIQPTIADDFAKWGIQETKP